MNVDGGWVVGVDGKSVLVKEFIEVLTQYDPVPGSHTGDVDARLAALDSEGVDQRARLPQLDPGAVRLARPRGPRALLPDLQRAHRRGAGAVGQPHLRRRPHQLVGRRGRPPHARRAQGARPEDLPACRCSPGKDEDKRPIDYASTRDGRRVGGHRGVGHPGRRTTSARARRRRRTSSTPSQIGMLQSVAPFRDTFGKYVLGGILDRHPGLQIGCFEGGINWVPSAIQDAQHIAASFRHISNLEIKHDPQDYWDKHMCASFMRRPARARAGRPDRRRPGDVVDRLPAQREHLRLQQRVARRGRRRGRRRDGGGDRRRQRQALPRSWTS